MINYLITPINGRYINEIRRGDKLGYTSPVPMIWSACEFCGKERWIQYVNGKGIKPICASCAQKIVNDKRLQSGYRPPPRPDTLKSIETGLKKCYKCGNIYPATEEYFQKGRGYLGIISPCKKCVAETQRLQRIRSGRQHYNSLKEFNDFKRISPLQRKLHAHIRMVINHSLPNGKNGHKWEDLVGYTCKDLMNHLESQFIEGMTWDNYGHPQKNNISLKWSIDHIIPSVAFNYNTYNDIDFKRCWSLNNLRPLWSSENSSKGCKVNRPFQPSLAINVTETLPRSNHKK